MKASVRCNRLSVLALALGLNVLGFSACLAQTQPQGPLPAWPHTQSDLAPNPDVKFGLLANGMRYVIFKNLVPAGQVSIRMRVATGSRQESDEQQGLAHYLEHMAFKGSTHVPGDGMIKILQRHGLAFGPDTNAQTQFGQTVYMLDLPKTDDDTIDTGLMLMRETASELTFDPKAFEDERGVILSEERVSDTPETRSQVAWMNFSLKGQRMAQRLPIGKVDTIKRASVDLVRDYYRAFYRPERTTLIVVGSIDPAALEAKIKTRFDDWRASAPPRPDPDLGPVQPRGATVTVSEVPGAKTSLNVDFVRPYKDEPDSTALRRRLLMTYFGMSVLNNRFAAIKGLPDAPFLDASASDRNALTSAQIADIGVDTAPDGWQKALAAVVAEQRRLAQFGVSDEELQRVIKQARTGLETDAAGASTGTNSARAAEIVQSLEDDQVYMTPVATLKLFDDIVKGTTVADVNAAIAESFGGTGPLVMLTASKAPAGGEGALKAEFEKAAAAPVVAPVKDSKIVWPYTSFGTPGTVVERKEVADLGVVMLRFSNGVRLNVKQTTFQKGQISVAVSVANGRLDMPKDKIGPIWASQVVMNGGVKSLSLADTNKAVSGAQVSGTFQITDYALQFLGSTRPDDLKLQLEILAAYATDAAYRPEAMEQTRKVYLDSLGQMETTAIGVLGRDFSTLLHNGDARWAVPDKAAVTATAPTDLQKLIQPLLAKGEIQISIVGDTSVEDAIRETAATFGALPPRPEVKMADDAKRMRFPDPTPVPVVRNHKGRTDQAAALVAWPTGDLFSDLKSAYAVYLLSDIVQERMRAQVRLTEGAAYTMGAENEMSTNLPGYGYLYAYVETPPNKVDTFFADMEKIVSDIRANGVSADELERSRAPKVEAGKAKLSNNDQWLSNIMLAQTEPRFLDILRYRVRYYQEVTSADIQKAAQAYLDSKKAFRMVVLPESAPLQ